MEDEKNSAAAPNTKVGGETPQRSGYDRTVSGYEDDNEPKKSGREAGEGGKSNGDEVTRKVVFSLAYIFGILFFLPLVMYKDDEAKSHANEGLILLILSIVGNAVFNLLAVIPILSVVFRILSGLYSLLLLLLGILGIVYVVTDKRKPLPIIGGIRLIK